MSANSPAVPAGHAQRRAVASAPVAAEPGRPALGLVAALAALVGATVVLIGFVVAPLAVLALGVALALAVAVARPHASRRPTDPTDPTDPTGGDRFDGHDGYDGSDRGRSGAGRPPSYGFGVGVR